ncbi:hypothetical protein [Maritimibacter sp. DP1N21-5]|uniref:hypothetical protein n=1 Tax=Maritimibacter sp. DP1N21-5 TaxID=2836867 RepID=UPI001C45CF48|nr:hypothetical protein [Maritimibacter sp. DP1N21-5]MBV7408215.1 hypothetical protein [Maritimibacter sp. DP1N21-5]
MTLLDLWNHVSSLVAVLACWWLSHQYARAVPPGRVLAGFLALLGMSILLTMVQRVNGVGFEGLAAFSKSCLAGILIAIAWRNYRIGRDR